MNAFRTFLVCLSCLTAAADPATTDRLDTFLQNVAPVLEGVESHTETSLPPAHTGEVLQLDVEQCVALALKNNVQATVAEEDLLQREAQTGQARAARRPQVKAQAGITYIDGLENVVGDVGILSDLIGVGDLQPDKTIARATVGVEQVLYAGGQITAAIRASEYLAASEEFKRDATLAQLQLETRQAYYDCLLTQALVEVAAESIAAFERHREDARHAVDAGIASKVVLLRAETELAARQTDLTAAQTAEEIALLNLRRITGLPDSQRLALDSTLAWTPENQGIESLLEQARAQRPELKALDNGIDAAKQAVRVKRGDYYPKAAATVQYQASSGTGALQPDGITATLGAEWGLYAGGKRKHAVAEAQSQVRSLEKQREDIEKLVALDVRQAHLRLGDAIKKIKRDKGTVTLAEEGQRLAQVRFREGMGTQSELLDASLALTQAKTKLVQALRDYAVAVAALQKAAATSTAPAPAQETDAP